MPLLLRQTTKGGIAVFIIGALYPEMAISVFVEGPSHMFALLFGLFIRAVNGLDMMTMNRNRKYNTKFVKIINVLFGRALKMDNSVFPQSRIVDGSGDK